MSLYMMAPSFVYEIAFSRCFLGLPSHAAKCITLSGSPFWIALRNSILLALLGLSDFCRGHTLSSLEARISIYYHGREYHCFPPHLGRTRSRLFRPTGADLTIVLPSIGLGPHNVVSGTIFSWYTELSINIHPSAGNIIHSLYTLNTRANRYTISNKTREHSRYERNHFVQDYIVGVGMKVVGLIAKSIGIAKAKELSRCILLGVEPQIVMQLCWRKG